MGTEEQKQAEELAEKIADAMLDKIYKEAGKSLIKWFVWVSFLTIVALGVGLGVIKIPGAH